MAWRAAVPVASQHGTTAPQAAAAVWWQRPRQHHHHHHQQQQQQQQQQARLERTGREEDRDSASAWVCGTTPQHHQPRAVMCLSTRPISVWPPPGTLHLGFGPRARTGGPRTSFLVSDTVTVNNWKTAFFSTLTPCGRCERDSLRHF